MDVKVNHITTDEYPTKAKRPLNSRLSKEKLDKYFHKLPFWEISLEKFIKINEQ